jgi:hypothetical protein
MFGAFAAPSLMTYLGTRASVTIVLGDTTLVRNADAILRHVTTLDEYDSEGNELKRLNMEVDLLVDESVSYKGLAGEYNNAVAIIDGERWGVDRIGNKTETFQRLVLVRKEPRGRRRTGFYR